VVPEWNTVFRLWDAKFSVPQAISQLPHDAGNFQKSIHMEADHSNALFSNASATPFAVSLWQDAATFAAKVHRDQTCPGTIDPYFSHPSRVALLVSASFGCHDPAILATAYLHDVLEKTSTRPEDLKQKFGQIVSDWVEWLSKNAKEEKGPYWDRLSAAPWQARLVKLADALDHLNGPAEYRAARIKSAKKALKLAFSNEPQLETAASELRRTIEHLSQ
jgi:guanosine-3',5'-bis(diphosphate) 3'-pyrophosphohydrolase